MKEQLVHEKTSESEWSESFYLNFTDPKLPVYFATRIGFKPNLSEGLGYVFIVLPDGKMLTYFGRENTRRHDLIRVGDLEFKRRTDGSWDIHLSPTLLTVSDVDLMTRPDRTAFEIEQKEIELRLDYRPINEIYDYAESVTDDRARLISGIVVSGHLEQSARVTGFVRLPDRTLQLSGMGERDHSWGVRDWTAPKRWIYVTAHFGQDLNINFTKLITVEGDEVDAGYVFRDGRNLIVKSVELVDMKLREDGFTHESTTLRLLTAEGNKWDIKSAVKTMVPLPFSKGEKLSVLNQGFSDFICNGTKGFGVDEQMVKLQ